MFKQRVVVEFMYGDEYDEHSFLRPVERILKHTAHMTDTYVYEVTTDTANYILISDEPVSEKHRAPIVESIYDRGNSEVRIDDVIYWEAL